jgi:signal transduction histidine kinase
MDAGAGRLDPGREARRPDLCCDRRVRMRLVAPRDTLARDVQYAVGAIVVGVLLDALRLFASAHASGQPVGYFLPPLLAVSAALALRRVAPVAGLALAVVGLAADLALGGSIATILVFTQALYEVCVHGPPGLWRWTLRASVILTVAATAVAMALTRSWTGAAVAVLGALVLLLPVLTAVTVRQYRDQAEAARVRAELAELDRRHAVAAERTRMARELHDVIANHLSAVAIHASALLSVPDLDPAAAQSAVRVIRENSVQGLAEMRRMVELLRDPEHGEDAAAVAGLSDVDSLVARAGLTTRLMVTGQPRPLPVATDLAAYRIVQESLTNALKHGDGDVDVAVEYGAATVRVTVANPLRAGGVGHLVPGGGAGLTGMRERAELVGGRLDAGPDGVLWRVRVELPAEGGA